MKLSKYNTKLLIIFLIALNINYIYCKSIIEGCKGILGGYFFDPTVQRLINEKKYGDAITREFLCTITDPDNTCNNGFQIHLKNIARRKFWNKKMDKSQKELLDNVKKTIEEIISNGNLDKLCNCYQPNKMSRGGFLGLGNYSYKCVCAKNIVGDGIDGYTALPCSGCNWPQFWNDWAELTFTKCDINIFI